MLENHLDSIPWISLTPQEPDYLFIPQDEELKKQYDKGISVKDIFVLSSVGIATAKDSVLIANDEEKLKKQVEDYYQEFESNFIKNIAYRPFDTQKVYFDPTKVERTRINIMEHFLGFENIGLVYDRGGKLQDISNFFVNSYIADKHLVGGNSYVSPLYLYPTERSKTKTLFDEGIEERIENFAPDFREKIDLLYQEHFSPEVILGYLYAVLFHKRYREQYVDFLKIDFPKIPLVEDKSIFLLLSDLGQRLIALHLLKSDEPDSCIGEPLYESDKNLTIEQSKYMGERIIINSSLYFDKVSPKVWDYRIGGYQVLDKYLKSHKGEQIDYHHFQKVIQTLSASLEIEEQIAKIDIGV